jgi:hypothetical protein
MTGIGLPMSFDPALATRLEELRRRDREARADLVESGELFGGYHPLMELVHHSNARALAEILDECGWPGRSLAGEEGAEAAWQVAQHAISLPDFQRRCLGLLREAAAHGEVPARQVAMLEDRIRFNERRPQRFGTVFDWDSSGELRPWRIDEPEEVEHRRTAAGLPPLSDAIAYLRRQAEAEGDRPPDDWEIRQREIEEWARRVGWIS